MPAAFGTVKCAKKPATETTKMLRDKFKFGLALCQEIEEFAKMIEEQEMRNKHICTFCRKHWHDCWC
jgi:ribosomal protein L37AE/L43A